MKSFQVLSTTSLPKHEDRWTSHHVTLSCHHAHDVFSITGYKNFLPVYDHGKNGWYACHDDPLNVSNISYGGNSCDHDEWWCNDFQYEERMKCYLRTASNFESKLCAVCYINQNCTFLNIIFSLKNKSCFLILVNIFSGQNVPITFRFLKVPI